MPVSPSEAASSREHGNAAYDEACRRIDRMLSTDEPNSLGQWWFSIVGIPPGTRSRLLAIYRGHGWSVEVAFDNRDGDALVFTDPHTKEGR